jgi:hypothetical protein
MNKGRTLWGICIVLIGIGIGGWGFDMNSHCNANPNYHFECPVRTGFIGAGIGFMIFGAIVGIDGYRRRETPNFLSI